MSEKNFEWDEKELKQQTNKQTTMGTKIMIIMYIPQNYTQYCAEEHWIT